MRLIGPPEERIWYFAYGANMHDSAFRDWRGMRPIEWRPARLPGYRLRFDVRQFPGRKMAYANLCADAQAEVWGVLYKITRRELVRLDATEGIPWSRYDPEMPVSPPGYGTTSVTGAFRALSLLLDGEA